MAQRTVRAAAAQIAPDLASADGTLARVLETLRDAAKQGVELIDPAQDDGRAPATALAGQVQAECLRRGLIVELGGRHGCVVRFLPPLIITAAQIDHVCEIFAAALQHAVNTASLARSTPDARAPLQPTAAAQAA